MSSNNCILFYGTGLGLPFGNIRYNTWPETVRNSINIGNKGNTQMCFIVPNRILNFDMNCKRLDIALSLWPYSKEKVQIRVGVHLQLCLLMTRYRLQIFEIFEKY